MSTIAHWLTFLQTPHKRTSKFMQKVLTFVCRRLISSSLAWLLIKNVHSSALFVRPDSHNECAVNPVSVHGNNIISTSGLDIPVECSTSREDSSSIPNDGWKTDGKVQGSADPSTSSQTVLYANNQSISFQQLDQLTLQTTKGSFSYVSSLNLPANSNFFAGNEDRANDKAVGHMDFANITNLSNKVFSVPVSRKNECSIEPNQSDFRMQRALSYQLDQEPLVQSHDNQKFHMSGTPVINSSSAHLIDGGQVSGYRDDVDALGLNHSTTPNHSNELDYGKQGQDVTTFSTSNKFPVELLCR